MSIITEIAIPLFIAAIIAVSILMFGFAKVSQSTLITYKLEGVIEKSIEPSLIVGEPYSATLSFDTANLSTSPAPLGGVSYSSASFSFTSGAASLSGDSISIEVENNTPADNDVIRISGTLRGSFSSNLRINLINFDKTLFDSNTFPDPFPILEDFDSSQLLINTTTTNFASIEVFEPVI